ncbi:c-type cytochrome [Shewanella sp.]|uniref:c-type cytochrome n=1 Tax=Shewanella sp. TaxID=50422 RepID=UPI001EC6FE68|nr:c-type cytochrome [Shewanella sp.]NRB22668.1 cytochrome c5 family protein [Shewanella sp.]
MKKNILRYLSIKHLLLVILATSFSQQLIADEINVSGQAVFVENCASCHSGGFKGWITGAPAIGEKQAWQEFLAKGVDKMSQATIEGVDGMDPMGGCDSCTEEQIVAAVEYLVSQTQ